MFTGLIEGTGKIKGIQRIRDDMRITVSPAFDMTDFREGESIAINGVCLTVTDIGKDWFGMDVSGETLDRSTLGSIGIGELVNLERALRLSERLGGHLVSGHVDGIGKIVKKEPRQRSWLLRIKIQETLSRHTIKKGSVTVDGISLTINTCGKGFFDVNVIPQTGMMTTLLTKNVGDQVNIETDLIGKYVEKFLSKEGLDPREKESSKINLETLKRHGFGE